MVQFVGLDATEHCRRSRAGCADNDEVAQALQEVLDEATRILAGLDDAIDRGERGRGIPGAERIDHFAEQGTVRVAEQGDRALVLHRRPLGSGDELVEQGEGVAHGPAASPHHEGKHSGLNIHLLTHAQ